jgi:probable phosphoglycerate mutase
MELLLIRHARPRRVEHPTDAVDPELAPLGQRQADALAAWLRDEDLAAIYTSPLLRARQTAAPLAGAIGRDAEVEPRIAEWDRDATAYIPIEEMKADGHDMWDALSGQRWDELGVDPDAFRDRVLAGIDEIASRHAGESVAVVAHGGVINAYAGAVLGRTDLLFFEPGYTSISRVLVSRAGQRSIRSLNEMGHLRDVT